MLKFGYNHGLPAGAETGWGCRAIVGQDGYVDVVPDRVDAVGPDGPLQELLTHLTGYVGGAWRERASELLRTGVMNTRQAAEFVLYQDSTVLIKGNTQGSGGYLYVCAFLIEDVGRVDQ